MSTVKWDVRFLRLAREVSSWSKDPSTKVGAVIVDENKRVVSLGYNGFPSGIADLEHLYSDRPSKYERVLHAEQNAILFAAGTNRENRHLTLYTNPLFPCNRCALEAIQIGIKRVVSPEPTGDWDRWKDHIKLSLELFKEAGVQTSFIPLGFIE